MRDFVDIGGTPCNEACAQIGDRFPHGQELNKIECRAYVLALRRHYGPEPEGASLVIKANPHDFGTWREVRCTFERDSEAAREYAYKVENGLALWADARMVAPIVYDDAGRPLKIRTKDGVDMPFSEDAIALAAPEFCCWDELDALPAPIA
jgi:hypothetical protein